MKHKNRKKKWELCVPTVNSRGRTSVNLPRFLTKTIGISKGKYLVKLGIEVLKKLRIKTKRRKKEQETVVTLSKDCKKKQVTFLVE